MSKILTLCGVLLLVVCAPASQRQDPRIQKALVIVQDLAHMTPTSSNYEYWRLHLRAAALLNCELGDCCPLRQTCDSLVVTQ